MKLSGRTALVTGGARRLGREIVLGLAREGADVALSYLRSESEARETETLVRSLGRRSLSLRCDVRDPDEVGDLVARVWRELGALDILVVNAAVFRRTPIESTTEEDWREQFEVNAAGAFRCAREVGLRMRERGGAIVFLADVAGLRPWRDFVPYSASKAAVISLTRGLALALAPNVRVNAVAPGPILPAENLSDDDFRKAAEATLLRRAGTPRDIAEAVSFLAAAPYVTGVVLPVDGGRHLR
ncbi:MAG: 3-ketoacyl-ACP reductase [Candidatus Binatia bacterium]|nr:MAG: 3-ketoacyl-ACP reductase [Candidatus Binatia bacterium]